ncbi:MAG: undecaprenyl-diphosphate phosphatase [Deltaproteobacteria bacterium]|nr:undecaprenyl-diphosphate phosphatase [Deltaproteobacteria bacterium]
MIQGIVLGIIQGITEWLPVSSEGLIVLAKMRLFGGKDIGDMIHLALFLHLGTFLAALIYFRKEVFTLIKATFQYKRTSQEHQALIRFLLVTTLVSGVVGVLFLQTLVHLEDSLAVSGKVITILIGLLLLITAGFQLTKRESSSKGPQDTTLTDALILGIVQGFSVLPGLSRSGLTISALLLRKFDDTHALTLSFLMSLPVVLGVNIVLNVGDLLVNETTLWGCLFAFLFGLVTIHLLLSLSKKINFAYFVLFFGLLMIVSGVW